MSDKKKAEPVFDPALDPNTQPSLMGGLRVPFTPTAKLRWVKRRGPSSERYVLQQLWARTITTATLGLRRAHGNAEPAVAHVWVDVPRGEE